MNLPCLLVCGLTFVPLLSSQTVVIKPYVQPAESSAADTDTKLLIWFTDQKPGAFTVNYGATTNMDRSATPTRVAMDTQTNQHFFKYTATLPALPLDAQIHYRVQLASETVRESSFASRKSAGSPLRFIVVGDAADGKAGSKRVAQQIGLARPDFMLVVGDIVYSRGRVFEYLANFWGMYNNTVAISRTNGFPFMQSVPVHAVLGNHDVSANNLTFTPDGMGAFYFFHAPTNGPRLATKIATVTGASARVATFKSIVGAAHPALSFYSFDNGPAHFLCLDANSVSNITDRALHRWIADDLSRSRAAWKFVFFHHPGFHSSVNHYSEQRMRLLSPLFEAGGVDVVFAGHVHNYQRSKPLKFAPQSDKPDSRGYVDGQFTLDEKFDGQINTQPDGIIHLVTGGGGAGLYNSNFTNLPEKWVRPIAWAPYTVKFIADRNSFTLVELDPRQMTVRQLDDKGAEVDRFKITKPK